MSTVRSFSQLAAGAALSATSFAAATGPMVNTTINSFSASITAAGGTGTALSSVPTNSLNTSLAFPGGSNLTGSVEASYLGFQSGLGEYWNGFLVGAGYSNSNVFTSATSVMQVTVTITEQAKFYAKRFTDGITAWTLGGVSLSQGYVLTAGTYTFDGIGGFGTSPDNSPGPHSSPTVQFGFYLGFQTIGGGGGGAVPLPGAAGVAAVGLVGLRGRRRR